MAADVGCHPARETFGQSILSAECRALLRRCLHLATGGLPAFPDHGSTGDEALQTGRKSQAVPTQTRRRFGNPHWRSAAAAESNEMMLQLRHGLSLPLGLRHEEKASATCLP